MSRTDQEIVDQTNVLAHRMLAEGVGTGYVHEEGESFKLYEHLDNPRYERAWQLACTAQEVITQTDPNDALSNLEPDPTDYVVTLMETVYYKVTVTAGDEDTARRLAKDKWLQSGDPDTDFNGQPEGVEAVNAELVADAPAL